MEIEQLEIMHQETVKGHVCDETLCSHTLPSSPPAFGNDTMQLPFSRTLQRGACV